MHAARCTRRHDDGCAAGTASTAGVGDAPARRVRRTAARYENGSYIEIPGSDHLVFSGEALSVTMGHIDDWIGQESRALHCVAAESLIGRLARNRQQHHDRPSRRDPAASPDLVVLR